MMILHKRHLLALTLLLSLLIIIAGCNNGSTNPDDSLEIFPLEGTIGVYLDEAVEGAWDNPSVIGRPIPRLSLNSQNGYPEYWYSIVTESFVDEESKTVNIIVKGILQGTLLPNEIERAALTTLFLDLQGGDYSIQITSEDMTESVTINVTDSTLYMPISEGALLEVLDGTNSWRYPENSFTVGYSVAWMNGEGGLGEIYSELLSILNRQCYLGEFTFPAGRTNPYLGPYAWAGGPPNYEYYKYNNESDLSIIEAIVNNLRESSTIPDSAKGTIFIKTWQNERFTITNN
jgi:hypothetical protein